MIVKEDEQSFAHYGTPRHSGRYPWGSGDPETARNRHFLDSIAVLKKEGMSESAIADSQGMTTTQLRAQKSIARAQIRQDKQLTVQRLLDKGMGYSAIGRQMGLNESSVRSLAAPGAADKANALQTTANMLADEVADKKYIDVGKGVERQIGVTRSRLDTAVAVLRQQQGYELHTIHVEQVNIPGKFTIMKILAAPGTPLSEVNANRKDISQIAAYSDNHGRNYNHVQTPINVSSRRIKVNYGPEGGSDLDGLIYIRPGVKDLAIGSKNYGQVRIAVDGTHYLKGMAVYKDGLPEGTDIVFNTSKPNTGRKKDAMKQMTDDPEFPFGSIVRQIHGPDGKVTSALNLVGSPTQEGSGEEGSWDKWSKTLSSQMLSKQSPKLAKTQLNMTYEQRLKDFQEISSLTNPTVRKELLLKFAESTDSASVHLKAANLPRQATKVLLPLNSIKPTEIFAPSFNNGERVVLIRFPHGGTFEIPELLVNNQNREARRIIGSSAMDAIGIHHTVAQHLSGADFDGDTVLVIPNDSRVVDREPALEGLKGFDPHMYKIPKDSPIPRMTEARKGQEMGKISNLITDMTIGGATNEEKARAIKHSMVVIDAVNHELDFVQSAQNNSIKELKQKYQYRTTEKGTVSTGAKTLISRAKSPVFVPNKELRKPGAGGPIDKETGKLVFVPTGKTKAVGRRVLNPSTGRKEWVDSGRRELRTTKAKALAETDDAHTLSSGTEMETIYADHSNRLKALANAARKDAVNTKAAPTSKPAKAAYRNEVASIDAKLNVALKNAPLERQSQLIAQVSLSQRKQANPNLEKEELKKLKQFELNKARARTGAGKDRIKLTQSEWNAIQAGAISPTKLETIIRNADLDNIRFLALPKNAPKMTSSKMLRAQTMLASGFTQAEVANALGVGLTTLKVALSE